MPTVIDQAVCIRQWDWSETSQTVSVFARGQGVIRGVAKGARRERAPFSGGLEVLARGEVTAIVRPASDLANITAWDLQETFPALRRGLAAFYSGMYMADLVHHSLSERDPHPGLFDRLVEGLRGLGDAAASAGAVLRFQWAVLEETGYRPEVSVDVVGGGRLEGAKTYAFLPRAGGFSRDGAGGAGPVWRVRGETLEVLRGVAGEHGSGAEEHRPPRAAVGGTAVVDRANRLLAAYLREVLGREVPAAAALFGELRA